MRTILSIAVAIFAFANAAHADIYQWEYINPADPSQGKQQSTTLAPGGAGVDAVPGAILSFRDLTMAYLIGADLTNVNGYGTNLTNADLSQANLTNAYFLAADLTMAYLIGAHLTGTDGSYAKLTNADLSQADLSNVYFGTATLTGANLTGAEVRGADFSKDRTGITLAQLYSTASYQTHDLTGIGLNGNDLTGGNFADQNLTNAYFGWATLTNADFTGAEVRGAALWEATFHGFTASQLYATTSYKAHDLSGIDFFGNDFGGWNFAGQNLTAASFYAATLTDTNFTDAEVRGASFALGPSCNFDGCYQVGGVSLAQLYSTASYQAHDLSGINLAGNNLAGGNFASQNLADANFAAGEDLVALANLTGANLREANFANANFAVCRARHCDFATLANADLTAADARGAQTLEVPTGAITMNLIRPDGHIDGLDLEAGSLLLVRDYDGDSRYEPALAPIPITIDQHLAMGPGGSLRMVFEADAWDSTISFAPGIPITLGGTLELTFAADVNLASQLKRTFDLFDWTGVTPTGAFAISSPYAWDLSNLYTTGEVTLTAIPEPSAFALAALALVGLVRIAEAKRPRRTMDDRIKIKEAGE